MLERVNLGSKASDLTRNLSGGQKQRLAIGMALIHDPELLILDEPTSGLDPAARRQLHEIILDLSDRGRTIILTTHYIEEAEKLCQRVVILNAGQVVADGTPLELVGRSAGKSDDLSCRRRRVRPVAVDRRRGHGPGGCEAIIICSSPQIRLLSSSLSANCFARKR